MYNINMILIGKLLCGFWSQYLSRSSLLVFNWFIFDDFFPRDNRIDLMSKLCFGCTLMFALPCRRTPSSELRSCVVILPEKELDKKCLDSSRFLEVENWNMKPSCKYHTFHYMRDMRAGKSR